ncbi:MAG: alcohol dehydrogenase catalytic domain-containing protein [Acidobacteriota bacterium]
MTHLMRALWLDRHRLTLCDTDIPRRAGECLVRVTMAGVCGTDLQLLAGYAGFTGIPGHEFVGIVEEVSRSGDRHWEGQRVVGNINVGCGTCARCRQGVQEHCETREVLGIRNRHGAFAEYLSLPSVNLHPVPDGIPDPAAVLVEPLAASCRILEQVVVDSMTRAAVLGDGRMGLLVAQVLGTTGASPVLFGRHEPRLALARSLGLDARPSPEGPLPMPDRFDVVVDVTGRPDGLERALGCVVPRGTIVLKTTVHDAVPFATWPVVVDEITVVGSRCGPFKPAIDLLECGAIRVAPLVDVVRRLDEWASALEEASRGLKVLFDPGRAAPGDTTA